MSWMSVARLLAVVACVTAAVAAEAQEFVLPVRRPSASSPRAGDFMPPRSSGNVSPAAGPQPAAAPEPVSVAPAPVISAPPAALPVQPGQPGVPASGSRPSNAAAPFPASTAFPPPVQQPVQQAAGPLPVQSRRPGAQPRRSLVLQTSGRATVSGPGTVSSPAADSGPAVRQTAPPAPLLPPLPGTQDAPADVPAADTPADENSDGKKDGEKKDDDEDGDKDEEETIDDRVEKLEKAYKKLQEEDEELADRLSGAVFPGSSNATMKIGGRIHTDYWAFPGDSAGVNVYERGRSDLNPEDRFGFRRVRFGVAGTVSTKMRYKIEMEFAGGNDTEYRDVYLGFDDLPVLRRLQIGNQKRPYGLDHLNSSRYNVFLERPFIIEAFNQDARRLGIASYGHSADEFWNWRYGVYNMRLIQDEAGHFNDHYQLELAGRLAATVWYDEDNEGRNYAHLAMSGTLAYPNGLAPNNGTQTNEAQFRHRPEARSTARWIDTGRIEGADSYTLNGIEGVLNLGRMQLVGEYQNVWMQRSAGFGPNLHFHGGYAYVSYFLTGEYMPWNRKTGILARVKPKHNFFLVHRDCCEEPDEDAPEPGWGAWQVAARMSYGDLSDRDILGGRGTALTLGLNWWWNANARVQFNYINGRISDRPALDNATGLTITGGDYEIFGTRASIDF